MLYFARTHKSGRVSFKNILFPSRDSFPPSLYVICVLNLLSHCRLCLRPCDNFKGATIISRISLNRAIDSRSQRFSINNHLQGKLQQSRCLQSKQKPDFNLANISLNYMERYVCFTLYLTCLSQGEINLSDIL